MSVLRGKREIAHSEFENTFTSLYKLSEKHTIAVPKRRKKWLCTPINLTMNKIYRDIMSMSDFYSPIKSDKVEYRAATAEDCIKDLQELEKPLMVLWNVQGFETRKMVAWVKLINDEIDLLQSKTFNDKEASKVRILDWRAIDSAQFLKNMSQLHRYTHSKVANANMDYDSTQGAVLIEYVNDAFYEVVAANIKIPTEKWQYEERRKHISNAITCLKAMNRGLISYFNLMQYSERVMSEWSDMLVQELKMLTALQASDRQRFGSLK